MFATLTLNPAIDTTLFIEGNLRINSVRKVKEEKNRPGGKGINVAKVIATNGCKVIAGGILGEGEAPWFECELRKKGIECNFMKVPYKTRENIMVSDDNGDEIKLNKPGYPELQFDFPRLRRYCFGLAKKVDIIILSGSLPVRFPDRTYAVLIRLFHEAGKIVVLDTSGLPFLMGLREKPEIIKPNMQEFKECCKSLFSQNKINLKDAMRSMAANHEVVIVSDGEHGAYFCNSSTFFKAKAPEVLSVDTTGAGDALLGQFCCDYFPARKLTKDVVAMAVAAGSASVELKNTFSLSVDRVKKLVRQVKVAEIES